MGYCIGVAIGIEALMKRKTSRFITLIALSILLMSFAGRTLRRNIDWSSEEKLYEAGISINPPKGKTLVFFVSLITSALAINARSLII